jgi:predicted nucleic acid-binding protein
MSSGLVIDSSAALAVVLGEPEAAVVRARLVDAAGGPILALDLFWLEVVNVLVRRYGWEADAVVEAVRELDALGVETVALDRPLLLASIDLASAHGITAYDAAHLALAEGTDIALLTLDAGLRRAAGARSVIRPDHGTHEARATYSAGGRPPDWSRHGRYLAELRQAVGD